MYVRAEHVLVTFRVHSRRVSTSRPLPRNPPLPPERLCPTARKTSWSAPHLPLPAALRVQVGRPTLDARCVACALACASSPAAV